MKKEDFPCLGCLIFPLCRNKLIEYYKNAQTRYPSKNYCLMYSSLVCMEKCSILNKYVFNVMYPRIENKYCKRGMSVEIAEDIHKQMGVL